MNKIFILYFLLVVAVSGCGGGSASTTPETIATTDFILLASSASCANQRNRLWVIDEKQVLWDKAGNCADASFSQVLYGNTPQNILCSSGDSIAGPKTSCNDEQYRSLFLTASNNLDKADLGLGNGHQVQQLTVPLGQGIAIPLVAMNEHGYYGATPPANIVIKDADAWNKFLNAAQVKGSNVLIDFNKQMVLGIFLKTANPCANTQILKASSNGQKLTVEYVAEERIPLSLCDTVPTSPGFLTPSARMNLVMMDRIDLPVEFTNMNAVQIAFQTVDVNLNSGIKTAQNSVIKDNAAWVKLWAAHTNNGVVPPPAIDFSKRMVVAIFLGAGGSCRGVDGVNVWRSGGRINVAHVDHVPGPGTLCTANITTPSHLISLERSEEPVEVMAISMPLFLFLM